MNPGRRSLLAGCAGMAAGLLTPGKALAASADEWMKPALWRMETEALMDALPVRNPALHVSAGAGGTTLAIPLAGGGTRKTALNSAGRVIWNACDGHHTTAQIAGCVQRSFNIPAGRAYADTMALLLHLKMFQAIKI